MNKLLLSLMAMLLTLSLSGIASAADDGGLPDIAAYDDAAYDPLPDVISSQFDGLTTEVGTAETEMTDEAGAADNGGLPEISASDDTAYEALPDMVPAQ